MLPTSDHEGTPDAVAEAIALDIGTATEDRRISTRACRNWHIMLKGMGSVEARPCTVEDISEVGLYLRVPVEYGLAVGQRCEVHFGADAESPLPSTLVGETCYATVVRTEMLAVESERVIGAGLRFDQPLFF